MIREVYSNDELSRALDELIGGSGVTKVWLSERMGIPNQNFNRTLSKKNLSLDDANKILKPLRLKAKIIIEYD